MLSAKKGFSGLNTIVLLSLCRGLPDCHIAIYVTWKGTCTYYCCSKCKALQVIPSQIGSYWSWSMAGWFSIKFTPLGQSKAVIFHDQFSIHSKLPLYHGSSILIAFSSYYSPTAPLVCQFPHLSKFVPMVLWNNF